MLVTVGPTCMLYATGSGQAPATVPAGNWLANYREAAMAEEAGPLGHRQIIKRYFERIPPDRVEAAGLLSQADTAADGQDPAPARQEDTSQ